jgi:hypothetical protein
LAGLGNGFVHVDYAVLKVHVAPVELLDLVHPQPRKKPDGDDRQDLKLRVRLGCCQQCRRLVHREDFRPLAGDDGPLDMLQRIRPAVAPASAMLEQDGQVADSVAPGWQWRGKTSSLFRRPCRGGFIIGAIPVVVASLDHRFPFALRAIQSRSEAPAP